MIRVFSFAQASTQSMASRGLASFMPTGRAADPNVHGGETEVSETMTQGIDTEQGDYSSNQTDPKPTMTDKTYVPPNPPNPSSPKLESIPLNKPVDPVFQQKRHHSASHKAPIEDVSCAGMDGSPWPEDKTDMRRQRKAQEEDDKEYFKHHKASPLSEIEVADTRKPITRATDGYFGDERVISWRPEQIDTAEESLLRAAKMWRESATRGVPDWPHSRRLRELRGEDW